MYSVKYSENLVYYIDIYSGIQVEMYSVKYSENLIFYIDIYSGIHLSGEHNLSGYK